MNNESKGEHMLNEPDVGSGEKSPGQQDTQKEIERIPVQNNQQENRQGQQQGSGQSQSGQTGSQNQGQAPSQSQSGSRPGSALHPRDSHYGTHEPPHKSGKELDDDIAKSLIDPTPGNFPPKGN